MKYYSNGKLLLTGEYLVLEGANALATPTVYGQALEITEGEEENTLKWKSLDKDNVAWYEGQFNSEGQKITNPNKENEEGDQKTISTALEAILTEAKKLNPDFLSGKKGYQATSKLDFDRNWGLGSSSTLVNNVAEWAGVNAYTLLKNTLGGSGYDIACAKSNSPVVYSNFGDVPKVKEVSLNWNFKEHLYFVYLNKKQDSQKAVSDYKAIVGKKEEEILSINQLTEEFINCTTLERFHKLIERHEALISGLLDSPPVKETHFSDFKGSVKSLGAWGGDFVLAAADTDVREYFRSKGYPTIIPFTEMVK